MSTTSEESPANNRVCTRCVEEKFLQGIIRQDGTQDFCSYCEDEGPTLSIEEVADRVERAFEDHYERTPTEPDGLEYAMSNDSEIDYEWDREGEEAKWAIMNAVDASEEIAEDIRTVLEERHYSRESDEMGEESPFSEESQYAEKESGHGEYLQLWLDFERCLQTQARFFSTTSREILDRIFHKITDLKTAEGKPVIVTAGPGTPITSLYRARVFAGEEKKLKEALMAPWKYLGTPPSEAAGAGRMNARGIAVFYGARDAETAISEVRPPVGSKVAIANFKIQRTLRLLDLEALNSTAREGSIFDPATIRKLERGNFLDMLNPLMSQAVMPHEEASKYLTTQAVAEYLASVVGLDGIIFPSVQANKAGANIVLFHHAARVEEVKLPQGTTVEAQLETGDSDGIHPEYRVWETVPASVEHGGVWTRLPYDYSGFHDSRIATLQIELETIKVHHVRAVSFDADPHEVSRHRFEQVEKPI